MRFGTVGDNAPDAGKASSGRLWCLRPPAPHQALTIETAGAQSVSLQKVLSEDGKAVLVYFHSEQRTEKEQGVERHFAERFEAELQKLRAN